MGTPYMEAMQNAEGNRTADVQRQLMLQQMSQAAQAFQAQQQQQQRQAQARAALGEMLPELAQLGRPPGGPAPQPPAPGASSMPMAMPGGPKMGQMPPPPGVGFASPPPAAGAPGAPPMPQGAGPGAPMPVNGPQPGAGAPQPQPGWQALPKPPSPAPAGPGGIPPPPGEGAVMPKEAISVADLSKLLASKGIKGDKALAMIEEWAPYMDRENKAQLDTMKVQNAAQAAALKAYAGVVREAETRRHHGVLEQQGDKRLAQGQQRININVDRGAAAGGDSDLEKDPETRRFMAEQYWAGDPSVMQNLGRGAQGAKNITALRKEIVAVGKEKGKSPKDLAAAQAEFQGMKAGERTLGTRTANVEMAVTEAQNMADIVLDTSKKFGRTNFMPANKALKAFQDNTGSTESRQFGAALNSFINAYSRAISPSGVPTVHDKEHAREMLSTADSHEQVVAIMGTLKQEMSAAQKSPGQVKKSMREGFTGKDKADYVEIRVTKDGKHVGKKADGSVEFID